MSNQNEKKDILFINLAQYGKHIDSYKYCQYLNKHYNITYICFYQNLKKIEDDTKVIYLKSTGSSILNTFKMIISAKKLTYNNNYQVVYILYFMLCSFLKFFSKTDFILDIRTGSINPKRIKREKFNAILRFESKFFKKISIISESLMKNLKLNPNKCTIIPLGSDILSSQNKTYTNFHLLYIGTLSNRNIYQTVNGLSKFIEEHQDKKIEITYDIFGDGLKKDVARLEQSIKNSKLGNIIKYHGRKNHCEIQDYFDKCNIGVSYIPMTKYFDCQPPTKTFEYVNSGMVCLATATSENRVLINKENGLLFKDNENSFKEVLTKFYNNREGYKTAKIINTLSDYTWENIVNNKLIPFILKNSSV